MLARDDSAGRHGGDAGRGRLGGRLRWGGAGEGGRTAGVGTFVKLLDTAHLLGEAASILGDLDNSY